MAVARCGSLAGAALAMNLTVPALSRRIQLLESYLGVRLFRRLPRGLDLTEAGSAYFIALAPAWDTLSAATEAARRRAGENRVRVSVMPTFAANWLMPRLARFHERHGDVAIELLTSADLSDLAARSDLDCAIRLGQGPWPGLDSEAFLPVYAFPVASPSFAESVNAPRTPGDLLNHRLIGTDHQPAFWREWFDAVGNPAEPMRWRGYDNLQVVYEAAAAGLGIALGLDSVVRPYLDSGRLVRLLADDVRLPRCFHLVSLPDRGTPNRSVAQFRAWVFAEAEAFRASA